MVERVQVSKADFAGMLGLSAARVSQLLKLGMPVSGDGKIPVAEAKSWLTQRVRPRAAIGAGQASAPAPSAVLPSAEGRQPATPEARDFAAARAEREHWNAQIARLKHEQMEGRLVEIDEAEKVLFETSRNARDAWLNWPGRVAPLIAARLSCDMDLLKVELDEHVSQQLTDLGEPEADFGAAA